MNKKSRAGPWDNSLKSLKVRVEWVNDGDEGYFETAKHFSIQLKLDIVWTIQLKI